MKELFKLAAEQLPILWQLKNIIDTLTELVKIPMISIPAGLSVAIWIYKFAKKKRRKRD